MREPDKICLKEKGGSYMTEFLERIRENAYFSSLPAWVQENVLQSGVMLEREAELRRFSEKLMEEK